MTSFRWMTVFIDRSKLKQFATDTTNKILDLDSLLDEINNSLK